MSEKNIALAGIMLGMAEPVKLPENLKIFLTSDGMNGIDDFDFMLKNFKLSRRIPTDVRIEYEQLYCSLSLELEEIANELEKSLKEMRSTPKEFIHEIIQHSLDSEMNTENKN